MLEGSKAHSLPKDADDEFRRLPDLKLWHSATRAVAIGLVFKWFEGSNTLNLWKVLLIYFGVYFCISFELMMRIPLMAIDRFKILTVSGVNADEVLLRAALALINMVEHEIGL